MPRTHPSSSRALSIWSIPQSNNALVYEIYDSVGGIEIGQRLLNDWLNHADGIRPVLAKVISSAEKLQLAA